MSLKKYFALGTATSILALTIGLSSCSLIGVNGNAYVTSVEMTDTTDDKQIFTVYYSDGTSTEFSVGKGADGKDGKDGKDATVEEAYEKYVEEYGDISYADFLSKYLNISADGNAKAIAGCLQSSAKIYTEFKTTTLTRTGGFFGGYQSTPSKSIYTGSSVIYQVDADYTYLITNYHLVYDSNANDDNGSKIASAIYCYLYGSEGMPEATNQTDANNYPVYSYGEYAVACEYVGGSITSDIAVLRAKTDDLKAVNENIKAVTLADGYYVGETAIAVGNPEGEGISVTEGIVSVDNENITLAIDGTTRAYRSLRMDTAIYNGSSGGGLFNASGELIGITNAGDNTDQNINYAIPLPIVKGTVENIMYYYRDNDTSTNGAYKITLGVNYTTKNSKYVYDASAGYGEVREDILVTNVTNNSIGEQLGLKTNDQLISFSVGDEEYDISRSFDVTDVLLNVRAGDKISFVIERDGERVTTSSYTVTKADLAALA